MVEISEYSSKEEKLSRILDCLEELKTALAEVVDAFEDEEDSEEIPDMLIGALDAVEDAYDAILDVIDDLEV